MAAKKVKKVDAVTETEKLAKKLLKLMGLKAKPEISEDKKNNAILVDIQTTDEAGLIIGNRGNTLNSLQTVLSLMLSKKLDNWQRVLINVNNWRDKEERRLGELAAQAAERALSTGEPQYLYNLIPAQRRVVHLALAEEKGIETKSEGEGRERFLVVLPKK
jgi:spoIIIJ-associated protein